jgi:CRISPR-associated protein Cmr1
LSYLRHYTEFKTQQLEPQTMKTRQFKIQFHTPAFLGDANQSGRWRTPPFKAQLRQWWRVAYAAQQQFAVNVREMRDIEGHLFGHAWLENDKDEQGQKVAARRSAVRIRLSQWSEGKETVWASQDTQVRHPNVHDRDGREKPVGAQLYMGFGPLIFDRGTALKANAAIQAKEQAELAIAFPDDQATVLDQALQLMDLYGTVGGRSRNGWGSYSLKPANALSTSNKLMPSQALSKCLREDWPHALGADSQGLLAWQTGPHIDWASLMKTLAQTKIAMRTQFGFNSGKNATAPEDRHWLSYPVTNHSVASWGNNARLPNQLRFKVRPSGDGQLIGIVFHMPHMPPADFRPAAQTIERIWQQVHTHLDQNAALKRITA